MELKDADLEKIGVTNLIARSKLLQNQALLLKYNDFINSQDDQDPVIQPSITISQKSGFVSNVFGLPKAEVMQTPENSHFFAENNNSMGGGFGFGNVDFFLSGKLDITSGKATIENSIQYNPEAEVLEKDGSYVVLKSHYHVQDYKQEKGMSKKEDNEEDEDLKSIEYTESRIVPREEIKRQQKFNYLNMPKKELNKGLSNSPTNPVDFESEIKLQNLSCESLSYSVKEKPEIIGSDPMNTQITFNLPEISRVHCEIYYEEKNFFIRDLKSDTGTWLRVAPERPFALNSSLSYDMEIGQSIYRLDLKHYNKDKSVDIFWDQKAMNLPIKEEMPVTIGKSVNCSLKFPSDQCLSKLHCQLVRKNSELFLEDCKSLNGTWLRINCEVGLKLEERMELRIGNHLQKLKVLSIFVKGEQKAGKMCLVCKKEEVKTIVEPCLHVGLCGGCAKIVRICPECGGAIDKIIITG